MTNKDTKECPFCAETIKAKAIVCRYCGRDLPVVVTAPIVEKVEIINDKKAEIIKPILDIQESAIIQKIEEPKTEPRKPKIKKNPSKVKIFWQKLDGEVKTVIGLTVLCGIVIVILYNIFMQAPVNKIVYITPTTIIYTQKVTPTKIKKPTSTQNNERQQIINHVVYLLEQNTYEGYSQAYDELGALTYTGGKYRKDEELIALQGFAQGMMDVKKGNIYDSSFDGIPPDYNGVYSEKIRASMHVYLTDAEWTKKYNDWKIVRNLIFGKLDLPLPEIGMTAQQVRNSQWGSPNHINKTTTAYGVSEQWVYNDNRYIYLEDGIVTSIQQ